MVDEIAEFNASGLQEHDAITTVIVQQNKGGCAGQWIMQGLAPR